jgi:hypothetical protein
VQVGLPRLPLWDLNGSAYNARAEPRGRQAGNLTGRREGVPDALHCVGQPVERPVGSPGSPRTGQPPKGPAI